MNKVKAIGIRALRTLLQSLAGALAGWTVGGDWKAIMIGVVTTTASSVLMGVLGELPEVDKNEPS